MFIPQLLDTGDLVGITAPAGKLLATDIETAVRKLENWGLRVLVGKTIGTEYFKYSSTDEQRIADMQYLMDHPEVKAILCARGGYGSIRIIDQLDFSGFTKKPKWLIGFSDITVFHAYLNHVLDAASIHGPMAKTFGDRDSDEYLRLFLFGGKLEYEFSRAKIFNDGELEAKIIGGNLAILQAILGSNLDFKPEGKILFLEDIDIHLYELDRMLWSLSRAEKLETLAGIIIGDFTNVKDNIDPFGKNQMEVFEEHFKHLNIPIFIGFPGGHEKRNYPIVLNHPVSISIRENDIKLSLNVRNKY